MNIYSILKLNNIIKSHRIKFLGLWLLDLLDQRYLGLYMDPVMACNLRCKMCYFTDQNYVKTVMKGIMKEDDIAFLAKINFKNALKLQIGCGAEPTLFKHNLKLIETAKKYKIPYISMVTNGNLLSEEDVVKFSSSGLNEFILSLHGVHKSSYEDFMDKGDYQKFHEVLQFITNEKKRNPKLVLRINYTFNKDTFKELADFFDVFGQYAIDVIQLRPVDKIGETQYNDFSLTEIESDYEKLVTALKREAVQRNITFLYPESIKRNQEVSQVVKTTNNSSFLMPYTYCYISPSYYWKPDFDWRNESFSAWKKRNRWRLKLFKNVFVSRKHLESPDRNMLNYSVES
ncbi:radical SAM protein [Flavobacterium mekongense]|uniref:radical SAM protein n=1 Tax=Flavobacterium mekongense TaxID=3379707 RepID=UPI00399A2559